VDPITLITTAVVAGATNIGTDLLSEATKDGYQALMKILRRRFDGDNLGTTALAKVEQEPERWEAPLHQAVMESGVAQDQEVIQLAQLVLDGLKESAGIVGKNSTQVFGKAQGVITGDNTNQTNYFTDS
jgi:hypothetical protein